MRLRYLFDFVRDVRTVRDAIAVPKILWLDVKSAVASIIIRHTGWLGDAIVVEVMLTYHMNRARSTSSGVYCVTHARDAQDCPADCQLRDE